MRYRVTTHETTESWSAAIATEETSPAAVWAQRAMMSMQGTTALLDPDDRLLWYLADDVLWKVAQWVDDHETADAARVAAEAIVLDWIEDGQTQAQATTQLAQELAAGVVLPNDPQEDA